MRRPTLLAAALATAAVAQDAYAPEIDLYPVPENGLYPIFDPLDPYAAAGGCCVAASYGFDPGAAGLDPGTWLLLLREPVWLSETVGI
jgi:hypothetical protein